jgi:hypothetical protein
MLKKIGVILLIFFSISFLIYIIYHSFKNSSFKKNNTENFNGFFSDNNLNYPVITRYNAHYYFNKLDSEFIKLILVENLSNEVKNFKNLLTNTILVILDDPYSSSDKSAKNINNFLDNPNIAVCLSEDWNDNKHSKLFIWPIGLESKMFKNKELSKQFIDHAMQNIQKDKQKDKQKKILSNSHFSTYPKPSSGYRDDRENMIRNLSHSPHVDFWPNKLSQKETIIKTQNYIYSLCPEGNGLDTHRFYETYGLGVRPIVRKGPLESLHSQFEGVVVLDSWKDANKLNFDDSSFQPDLKMISLGYWLYRSLRSRCRILNFFTSGLCDEWRNFLHSVRQQGLEDLLIVFPLDKNALECVKKENIQFRTDLISFNLEDESSFGTEGFRNITAQKVKAIEIILREGFFVFYLDTDIVLLKNPIENYFYLPPRKIYMQSDSTTFAKSAQGHHCSGVIFISPSLKIADKMKNAYELILSRPPGKMDDQGVINETISDIGTLDPASYPNGHRYFNEREKCDKIPILIHNNWIIGLNPKIERFKKHGLWYIN